ncbi:hypothetical protein B296_00019557 [Ensete ventricosum]|uniref:Aminopeptidase N-like N-terminal domain-containing protein n=1 Tax=Ensete ventricosum TaxID=4639 RepID=A0A427B072_ENSVE|nr:hypothetical protein B296_00019557 [Ensete ventricosum]
MAEGQCIERFKSQPRLPGFAIPRRYDLFLRPDLSSCRFAGSVQIVVDVVDDTRFLILNAADLAIDGGSVWFRNPSSSKHNGEKKNMAVTQFEPADARRCFPCWDEPAFKVKDLANHVTNYASPGIKVRVYCQVGKSSQGKFALDVAVKTLDLYKK